MNKSRREFLKTSALGCASAPFFSALQAIRDTTRQNLAHFTGSEVGKSLKNSYMLDDNITYLNHASIGTIPQPVHQARLDYLALCEKNPWYYMWSGEWNEPREKVRQQVAHLLSAETDEIAITHNTTEAFNILANGLPLGKGDEVLFSNLNHDGASVAFEHKSGQRGFKVRQFTINAARIHGMNKEQIVALHVDAVRPETQLLVLPHMDNTVGLRHPVKEIAVAVREAGVPWIAVDAAQTVGMIPVDVNDLGIDLLAASPHKWLQSPKGLGIAYISPEMQEILEPMWVTWGQKRWKGARRFEDYGTRNLPEVLALGDAIAFHRTFSDEKREEYLKKLWKYAMDEADRRPEYSWYSPREWSLSGSLFAVEAHNHKSNDFFTAMFKKHGFVFRPFNTWGLNTNRISPNLATTLDDLESFFGKGESI